MNHQLQICTVCGYEHPCIIGENVAENLAESGMNAYCEDAEFRPMVGQIPSYKHTTELSTFLAILIECQKEIDEEDERERQEEAYNDPMSVGERAYEESRDMDAEAEENGYMRD